MVCSGSFHDPAHHICRNLCLGTCHFCTCFRYFSSRIFVTVTVTSAFSPEAVVAVTFFDSVVCSGLSSFFVSSDGVTVAVLPEDEPPRMSCRKYLYHPFLPKMMHPYADTAHPLLPIRHPHVLHIHEVLRSLFYPV